MWSSAKGCASSERCQFGLRPARGLGAIGVEPFVFGFGAGGVYLHGLVRLFGGGFGLGFGAGLGLLLLLLLPFPVLITLFFVFRNTIQLRGESFLWLPNLAAADPYFILPVLLGISMFLMQWIQVRSMPEPNQQMKMMMWIMPPFMTIIFLQFASGLNLYYATSNLAQIPQQYWIAKERQKLKSKGPIKPAKSGD